MTLPSEHISGSNTVEFLGSAVSETKAGYYLVEYQRDAVLFRYVAKTLEKAGCRWQQSLEWLDDNRAQGRHGSLQ